MIIPPAKPGRPKKQLAERPAFAFWKKRGLSTRAANALTSRGVESWEDLCAFTLSQIGSFSNIGPQSVEAIEQAARKEGVTLTPDSRGRAAGEGGRARPHGRRRIGV